MEISETVRINVKPDHLFRYPSEWDPRDKDKTKGGYLEGSIHLPPNDRNLKIIISTVPTQELESKLGDINPSVANVHPTLLHVIRKNPTTCKRQMDKEPVSNHQHFQQEFHLENNKLYLINKKNSLEEHDKNIEDKDFMFRLKDESTITLGKGPDMLNMVIHIPKTDGRARGDDISLTSLLKNRVQNTETLNKVKFHFEKKRSSNLKKMRLKVDVFPLEGNEDEHLGSVTSVDILDKVSKVFGSMEIKDVTPLVSCQEGGRKVIIVSREEINRDVKPMFILCDSSGRHLKSEEESLVTQPGETKPEKGLEYLEEGGQVDSVQVKTICNGKFDVTFITPNQSSELLDQIQRNNLKLYLILKRENDGYQSEKKYEFTYFRHGHYTIDSQCFHCYGCIDDGRAVKAALAPVQRPSGPGRKRRNWSSETSVAESPPPPNDTISGFTIILDGSGTSTVVPVDTLVTQQSYEQVNFVQTAMWEEQVLHQDRQIPATSLNTSEVQVLSPMSQLDIDWMDFQFPDQEDLGGFSSLEDILGDILFDGSQPGNSLTEFDDPGMARPMEDHRVDQIHIVDQIHRVDQSAELHPANFGLFHRFVTLVFGDDQEAYRVFGLEGNGTSLRKLVFFSMKEFYSFPIILISLALIFSFVPTIDSKLSVTICAVLISILCRRFLV